MIRDEPPRSLRGPWRRAASSMNELVDSRIVTCALTGERTHGREVGVCRPDDRDVAARSSPLAGDVTAAVLRSTLCQLAAAPRWREAERSGGREGPFSHPKREHLVTRRNL
jgi:hypothetical protein